MKKILKFVKNEYLFSIFAKVVAILISVAQSVFVARFLGADLRGNMSYITSIISITSIVITFGFHQAYPYFRKKYGKDVVYVDYMNIIYCTYIVYFFVSILLALLLDTSIEIKTAIILTPISGYSTVVAYVCLIEKPNMRNLLWVVCGAIDVAFVFFLYCYAQSNYFWMATIIAFIYVLKAIVYTALVGCKVRISRNMLTLLKELYKFGFFPMLALLMTTLNYRIDVLMLKQYSNISLAQIGIYSVGISVAEKIVLIPDTLKGVLASKLTKGANATEVARISRLCFWSSCLMCLAFVALGNWGISFLYGTEYQGAYGVMLICAVGALAIGFFKLIAQYNIVNHMQKISVAMLSIAITVDVVLNLLFIPLWGIEGAAFATCIGNFACAIVFVLWFSRKTGVQLTKMIFIQKSDLKSLRSMLKAK